MRLFLPTALVLVCAAPWVAAQSVRSSVESFPMPINLPVAPRAVELPSPAAAKPISPRQGAAEKWVVSISDVHLLSTFERWGAKAGYRVKWDASRHVLVDAPGEIEGSFEHAVESVLASPGIRQSDYPLEVCFYSNNVARVTRRGEQQKECK